MVPGEKCAPANKISISRLPFFQRKHWSISAGMVEDSLHSRFGRAAFNYGLNKRMTVGWGVEYLSSVTSGRAMPFLNTTFKMASNLLFSGEYTHGVTSKGVISYRFPSSFQFESKPFYVNEAGTGKATFGQWLREYVV